MPTEVRQRRQRRSPHLELMSLRINEGLSREQLGWRSGVSREAIRLAEAGFLPGPRVQAAIARSFKLRPLDLWPIDRQRAGR